MGHPPPYRGPARALGGFIARFGVQDPITIDSMIPKIPMSTQVPEPHASGVTAGPLLARSFFGRPSSQVAPDLLGQVLEHDAAEGTVAVVLTEVEAYAGTLDAASHAYRGQTRRNEVMFGAPGYAYVYFTYGMHFCVNLVCEPEGTASAVLLRAGRVIAGAEVAHARRAAKKVGAQRSGERDLARGPARLCQALAIDAALNGADICGPASSLRVRRGEQVPRGVIRSGPRTGVRGAAEVPWRFWICGEPTVSPYRAHTVRVRTAGQGVAVLRAPGTAST